MTQEDPGLLLTDGEHSILLHPPVSYPDRYGFSQRVDLVAGPFRGSIEVSSYEGSRTLDAFHEQLLALYESLAGEAHLPDTYDALKLSLTGDGIGHVKVRVDARTGSFMEVRLSFGFQLDQTYLPKAMTVIKKWIQAG